MDVLKMEINLPFVDGHNLLLKKQKQLNNMLRLEKTITLPQCGYLSIMINEN